MAVNTMIYKTRVSRAEIRHDAMDRKIRGEMYEEPAPPTRQEQDEMNWHTGMTQMIILLITILFCLLVFHSVFPYLAHCF